MIIGNQNPQRSHDPPPKDCFALIEPTRARQYLAFALHCIVEGHYFCVFSVAFVVRILSIVPIISKLAAKPKYPLFRITHPVTTVILSAPWVASAEAKAKLGSTRQRDYVAHLP